MHARSHGQRSIPIGALIQNTSLENLDCITFEILLQLNILYLITMYSFLPRLFSLQRVFYGEDFNEASVQCNKTLSTHLYFGIYTKL